MKWLPNMEWLSKLRLTRKLTAEHRENLFKLLDTNYPGIFGQEKVWQDLHAMDMELEPGCIYLERFDKNKYGDSGRFAPFKDGTQMLVWRLKNEKTANNAAEVLNQFFLGTGIQCVVRKISYKGETVPLLITNTNKEKWSQLAVFCKYRFDREIPQKDRDELHENCQKRVDYYLEKPDMWDATEGMPAAIALAGMHGLLRPADGRKPDRRRKVHELNENPPAMFRSVPVHVDIDRHGTLNKKMPYFIGYDPFRAALARTLGKEGEGNGSRTLLELIMDHVNEITGADVISRNISHTARGLHAGVLLSAVEAFVDGRLEPVRLVLFAGGGAVCGYILNQWIYIGSEKDIAEHPETLANVLENNGLDPDAIAVEKAKRDRAVEAIKEKAFSPENIKQLENLVRDTGVIERVAEETPAKHVEDVLATRISTTGGFGSLFRR